MDADSLCNGTGKEGAKTNMETKKESIFPLAGCIAVLFVLTIFIGGIMVAILPMDLTVCTVTGESMSPTLTNGSVVLLDSNQPLEHFDLAVFAEGDQYFIKRMVGLPGDRVTVMDGHLFINDDMYEEPYVAAENKVKFAEVNFTTTVPEGCYYVLGDNRDGSFDSREAGVVPEEDFIGVAMWKLKTGK